MCNIMCLVKWLMKFTSKLKNPHAFESTVVSFPLHSSAHSLATKMGFGVASDLKTRKLGMNEFDSYVRCSA